MRFSQFGPWLEDGGIEVVSSPLFSDDYVLSLQQNRRKMAAVLRSYAQRFMTLFNARDFDLLWIEKELLPWLPAGFEQALLSTRVPYVLDYDDAVFHYYDQHKSSIVRRLLGEKHPALMRGAVLVVAGNDYLADVARKAGAKRVAVLPTVIDLERYQLIQRNSVSSNNLPCVGWIGQRSTAEFLLPFSPLFQRLSATGKVKFAAIGADASSLGLPMESIPWSEESEVTSMQQFDIGIMPLVDGPFERGKCGYKLIQYMACGLPVVASPVGVNRQIVEHGVNGFLAETVEEWETVLNTLIADAALRQRMGQAGRAKVEQQYCIQVTGPKLVEQLKEAAISSGSRKK